MLVQFLKPLKGYNVKIGSQIHPIRIVMDIMEITIIVEMMIQPRLHQKESGVLRQVFGLDGITVMLKVSYLRISRANSTSSMSE